MRKLSINYRKATKMLNVNIKIINYNKIIIIIKLREEYLRSLKISDTQWLRVFTRVNTSILERRYTKSTSTLVSSTQQSFGRLRVTRRRYNCAS